MAIHERAREDLLRDGKGFCSRGEIAFGQRKLIVGFRKRNQIAIYDGEDPVFQFNAEFALRRAFFNGVVLRADGGRLFQMKRASKGGRVVFDSSPVSEVDSQHLFQTLKDCLAKIQAMLDHGGWIVVGEESDQFLKRLGECLKSLQHPIPIAQESGVQ